ncbi:MAG: hypothetical protein IJ318_00300 [Clostridia bacterium]|nr:hypothetical protein [Clostridia bacterium]
MKIGDIVISLCGHDMGEWYVVEQVLNEYVFLVDGKNKPIEKPKKKKAKHVLATGHFAESMAEKLLSKQSACNAEIRKTIKFFKEQK